MPRSDRSPAFQFYPADFLSDIHVATMSLAERGAYITLLCYCWNEGHLDANETRLARLCGVGLSEWRKLWEALAPCFDEGNGLLTHARLNHEREKQAEFITKQARNGTLRSASAMRRSGRFTSQTPAEAPAAHQPEHQPGHQPLTSSSSSSSFTSSIQEQEHPRAPALRSDGPCSGMLPKDHLKHALCDPTYSRCVPVAVHTKLVNALAPKTGGDRGKASDTLKVWYRSIWENLADDYVMGDAFRFWQGHFDAHFAGDVPSATRKPETRSTVPGIEETRRRMEREAAEDALYSRQGAQS